MLCHLLSRAGSIDTRHHLLLTHLCSKQREHVGGNGAFTVWSTTDKICSDSQQSVEIPVHKLDYNGKQAPCVSGFPYFAKQQYNSGRQVQSQKTSQDSRNKGSIKCHTGSPSFHPRKEAKSRANEISTRRNFEWVSKA